MFVHYWSHHYQLMMFPHVSVYLYMYTCSCIVALQHYQELMNALTPKTMPNLEVIKWWCKFWLYSYCFLGLFLLSCFFFSETCVCVELGLTQVLDWVWPKYWTELGPSIGLSLAQVLDWAWPKYWIHESVVIDWQN